MSISFEEVLSSDFTKKKENSNITNLERLGIDAIFHTLENSCEVDDFNKTSFEEDIALTQWRDSECICIDDITKVSINDRLYIFKHIFITEVGQAVVVVAKPNDIWIEDDDLIAELDSLNDILFLVRYN